jgi:small nuclear ribonucleoprotein (snRNP)-like protein
MDQPFDTLSTFRDKVVVVTKKNGDEVVGRLVAYDLNMNITMETTKGTEFINGFAVDLIMLRQEE